MIDIIPAIDLIGGKCVRLSQGDYNTAKTYSDDPLEMAKQFEDAGAKRLHLVDLDGAKAGEVKNLAVLERIAHGTSLSIDFSGGIKTTQTVELVFAAGAQFVAIGSIAHKDPALFAEWIAKYSPERILLGADVKGTSIAVGGWLESTQTSIFDYLEVKISQGLTQAFCTDISKDGLLQGPSLELYAQITSRFPQLQLIASGGVHHISDIPKLEKAGCKGVIIGKAIYEGHITLQQLRPYFEHA